MSPTDSERPKLPSLGRLREMRALLDEGTDEELLLIDIDLRSVLDWLITEIENRRFRYKKQWTKQKLLARIGKERLSQDELYEIDRRADELALRVTEQEDEHGGGATEGDPEATEADQGDSGEGLLPCGHVTSEHLEGECPEEAEDTA